MGGGGEVPFEEQYLTFEALESGTFTLTIPSGLTTTSLQSVSYSIDDGVTWVTTPNVNNSQVVITTPNIAAGSKVMWKGLGEFYATATSASSYSNFSSTCPFDAFGNIMSLLYGDNFVGELSLSASYAFCGLFRNSSIVNAENLIMPALTLTHSCYFRMFSQSLITSAPALPASILAIQSYARMFQDASYLNKVVCLATDISARNALTSWLQGVASNGTFVKDATMTNWPSGANGIPSGWTVEDAT